MLKIVIKRSYLSLFLILIGWSPNISFAVDPQLTADETSFDIATGTLNAKGNVLFRHSDLIVNADEVQYKRKENQALLMGDVHLTYNSLRLISDRLLYDIENEHIDTNNFRLGGYGLFAEGSQLKGNPEEINLENITFYLDEPSPLGINLKARSARFFTNDRIEAEHLFLRIGKVPFFYLPKYSQGLKQAPLNFSGDFGFRGDLGAYFQTETRIPLHKSLSAGGLLDFYSERGALVGPSVRYSEKFGNDAFIKNELWSGYIKDNGDREEDLLGREVDPKRYFLEYRHRQKFQENWSLTSTLSLWSDSEVLRDFRGNSYIDNQQPDNFLETVYTGKDYLLSAFARFDPNDFQLVQERLPEIRVDRVLHASPLEGFYQSYSADYVHLEEEPLHSGSQRDSDRLNIRYTLYRPYQPNHWLSITPVLGTLLTYYDDTLDNRSNYTRIMGEVGFDAEMMAHRIWRYKNQLWNINDLRHVIRPVVRYRYLPGGKYGESSIIPIDDNVLTTNLPPIDLNNIRFIDDLTDLHVVRFGLENLLQTRQSGYGSRDLIELNFYQNLHFSETENSQDWSDFYTQLKANPIDWLHFHFYQRFNPEALTLDETRTELIITDGDYQSFSLSTINLQNEIDQYNFRYTRRFNIKWSASVDYRFDTRKEGLVDQRYRLQQRLGNAWIIEYQLNFNNGDRREDDTEFKVRFDFIGF